MLKNKKARNILTVCFLFCFVCAAAWGLCACEEKSPAAAGSIAVPSTSTAFLYLGDSQSDPDVGTCNYGCFESLLEAAVRSFQQEMRKGTDQNAEPGGEPDGGKEPEILVVIGGDLINEENDEKEWDAFFQAVETAQKHTNSTLKIMPVPGNHTSGDGPYKKLFDLPDNGPPGEEELFCSFDYGNIRFLMTDSNLMGSLNEQVVKQLRHWLEKTLSQSPQPWNIVVTHHPLYPVGNNGKDVLRAETMRQNYLPIYEKHQVNLILCGHQHVYARTKPMDSGIVQIMGVSGGKHYAAGDLNEVEIKVENCSVFSFIRCEQNKLSVVTRDENSRIIDTYEKSR